MGDLLINHFIITEAMSPPGHEAKAKTILEVGLSSMQIDLYGLDPDFEPISD